MNYFSFRKYLFNNTTRLDGLTAASGNLNTGTFVYLTSKTPTALDSSVAAGPEVYLVAEDYTAGETEIVVYDVKPQDFYVGFGIAGKSIVTYTAGVAAAAVVTTPVVIGGQYSVTVDTPSSMQVIGEGTTNKHVEVVAVIDTPYTFSKTVEALTGESETLAGTVTTYTYKQVVFKVVRG